MGFLRRQGPISSAERERRIDEARAADPGVGVLCPVCRVHTPNLKPRRAKYGVSKGPNSDGGWGGASSVSHPDGPLGRFRGKGGTLYTYRCPVCDYVWSADPG